MCGNRLFLRLGRRAVSWVTVFAIVITLLPQSGLWENIVNEITAEAADTSSSNKLKVAKLWFNKSVDLNLVQTTDGKSNKYLQSLSDGTKQATDQTTITTSDTCTPTGSFWGDTSRSKYKTIAVDAKYTEKIDGAVGTKITGDYTITTPKVNDEEGNQVDDTVNNHAYTSDNVATDSVKESLYYTLETDSGLAVDTISFTFTKNGKSTAKQKTTTDKLYRKYYVSTADQLATLLDCYQNDIEALKPTDAEILDYQKTSIEEFKETTIAKNKYDTGSGTVDTVTQGTTIKVAIVLLCDIDLGKNKAWTAYKKTSVYLEIDGQGHTIYNGYFSNCFIGAGDQKFAIENVTFSDCFIGKTGGMFGAAKYAYFNNVNWNHCVAYGKSQVTIVLGSLYDHVYFKDCTISDSYAVGTDGDGTNGHCGMFASFNTNTAVSAGNNQAYYTSGVPILAEAERAWRGVQSAETGSETEGKTLVRTYPSIYENCATVNCGVYQTSTDNTFHSGVFVSCLQGNIIFINCFANGSIYGRQQLGVFAGSVIGSVDGFTYDGEKRMVVFKNCYASGEVEGTNQLGGFVGTVFNDARATGDSFLEATVYDNSVATTSFKMSYNKGTALFENCYSTSSVGMEYAGEYVGGFVGIIRGNVYGTNKKHTFINCYAAGEVGGIDTDETVYDLAQYTDDLNTNSIGGFVGTYYPDDFASEINDSDPYGTNGMMNNCYYDMQTTAMRERDIGSATQYAIDEKGEYKLCSFKENTQYDSNNETKYSKKTTTTNLVGTLWGLTGVYTKKSETKGVQGLCDSDVFDAVVDDAGEAVWDCSVDDYYPILVSMTTLDKHENDDSITAETKAMYATRQLLFYNYAYASTAAVLLDHYDTILDAYGNTDAESAATIYDTIRDITSKFAFASPKTTDTQDEWSEDNHVVWSINATRNEQSKFRYKLGTYTNDSWGDATKQTGDFDVGSGFTMEYTLTSIDAETREQKESGDSVQVNQNPDVIDIEEAYVSETDENGKETGETKKVYKCVDFAPGKQWVQVTYGASVDEGAYDTQGKRNIRLLPKAYLSAGGEIDVNVGTQEGSDTITNAITYIYNGETVAETNDIFNHYVGTAYAISDRTRLYSYGNTDANVYSPTDGSSLALTASYLLENPTSTAVGLDATNLDAAGNAQMYKQAFPVTVEGVEQNNNSATGMTMVKVFPAEKQKISVTTDATTGKKVTTYLLVADADAEITDSDTLEKWQGKTRFTEDDCGYYYMQYYWRLNDGRYLTDEKLVKISNSTHSVEVITGIAGEHQTISGTTDVDTLWSPIDQYVTDTSNAVYPSAYTSAYAGKTDSEIETTMKALYSDFDTAYTYGGELYYTKSLKIHSMENQVSVGWKRTINYRLTSLLIQIKQVDSGSDEWTELARVDENTGTLNFNNAAFSYAYYSYKTEQDSDSGQYTLAETYNDMKSINLTSALRGDAIEAALNFTSDNDDGATGYTSKLNEDIRVIALFKQVDADVTASKTVLTSDAFTLSELGTYSYYTTDADEDATKVKVTAPYYDSIEAASAQYEIDDTGITDDENRKAVLSGDTLVYRIRLTNSGYFDSDVTNVFDAIPDGTTYVEGSMKLYRQAKETSTGEHYGAAEQLLNLAANQNSTEYTDSSGTYSAEIQSDGTLHWQIPTVTLQEDYYAEYAVTVDAIAASKLRELITNTAKWDFTALNGRIKTENGNDIMPDGTSNAEYKDQAIFDMDLTTQDDANVTYTITFKQQDDSTNPYTDVAFTNTFPVGFQLDKASVQITCNDNVYNENKFSITTGTSEEQSTSLSFTIGEINSEDTYTVTFSGSYPALTSADQILTNKATVTYTEGSSTYNNTIYKTTRLTNQVETDVTHLYINVEKVIDEEDLAQKFLFQVERFDADPTQNADATPVETFYTSVSCTKEVETTDDAGNFVKQYVGNQLIQLDQRGYYRVTEITDWSHTDYEYASVGYRDVSSYYQLVDIPTSFVYPTVTFKNITSAYAYRSAQAYADNRIKNAD